MAEGAVAGGPAAGEGPPVAPVAPQPVAPQPVVPQPVVPQPVVPVAPQPVVPQPVAPQSVVPQPVVPVAPQPVVPQPMTPELAGHLMADVAREVRRRRLAGSVPEALEREVDAAFERFAPKGASGSHAADLLATAVRASVVDVALPVQGRRPGEAAARRLLRMSMAWYMEHVAQQARSFAAAEVGLLRTFDQRVSALEARAGLVAGQGALARQTSTGHSPGNQAGEPGGAVRCVTLSRWSLLVLELLSGTSGRVLHAECGDGWLVSELVERGIDAYGVDPAAPPPDRRGLDVWSEDVFAHLRSVSDGGLGGLVLSGLVDCVSPDAARRVTGLAAAKLAPGGRLVLIASHPPRLSQVAPTPVTELANGRPLHPQTWYHLFASAGLTSAEAHTGPDSFALTALAVSTPT